MPMVKSCNEILKESWFVQGMTDASAGDAKKKSVRQSVMGRLGLQDKKLITCKQVHGNRIAVVSNARKTVFPSTDGLLTSDANVVLGIFTADCAPVFLMEASQRVVGVLHAGWRGAAKGIARKGVERIKDVWKVSPTQIKACIGPHIRDCCYEVGTEVSSQFPASARVRRGGKWHLDIQAALVRQLRDAGVPLENICQTQSCTHCNPKFYSYRKDKTARRMLSFAAKVGADRPE